MKILGKIAAILSLTLFGIGFALFIIEIVFRMAIPEKKTAWNDRPKAYFITESSETFQDYPHEKKKPNGVYRIAVIGDSFTFAPFMQFDDAFPKRLERWLNLNKGTKKVEVINYGVPAYSANHEVPVVKQAIDEGADFILMQITFNDPELKPYTPVEMSRDKNKFGELVLEGKIFKHWKSLAWALKRIHNTETHKNYKKKFFDLFNLPLTWSNFSESWKKMVIMARESKTPMAAVVFPLYGIPLDERYPFEPIHKKVAAFLESMKIPSFDLFETFRGIPLERLQVLVGQDFHPNEIGHRMAAEAILEWLHGSKLIPEEFYPRVHTNERIGIIIRDQARYKTELPVP